MRWLLTVSFLCVVVGCGGITSVKHVPVSGTVMLGGKPLAEGTIVFHPNVEKGNKSPQPGTGAVADGKYSITTQGKEGLPLGEYYVTVTANAEHKSSKPKDEYAVPKSLLNSKYGIPEASGLTATVTDGGGPYDFTVTK